ncbi:nuclease A inhibitor-like protein [Pontibacter ummariensis]|uniref:Nuclease A inhibitor-like protein n=1 Tax=Pontibacter ummariensis TaxID=1610492 RepID=A0A239LPU1_9BACT|nr:nuclease A inhibitor family protein [Pontibacter ummariensis]PRY02949.1 nuclease A inhibitor-like protein [Pontibacter ummariensis]SNT31699.1 Nuclease A inhibitor-like protein [Pontibacter ummariensis]
MENTNASAFTNDLLQGLKQHSEGLYYLSETDAPFEVVHFPASQGQEPTNEELTDWAGKEAGEKVETVELRYFFRNMSKETAEMSEEEKAYAVRFQELQLFIEQHLQEAKVYRVGQRRITALVLGKPQTGGFAGLKTNLVET